MRNFSPIFVNYCTFLFTSKAKLREQRQPKLPLILIIGFSPKWPKMIQKLFLVKYQLQALLTIKIETGIATNKRQT